MEERNLKSKPPVPKTCEELEAARQRFIVGEDVVEDTPEKIKDEVYPWEAPYVREDVKKLFSLRLSEPDMLKLQFINKKTGKSMHQFIMEAVLPAIEAEIERLTGKENSD
ncbi:hypothetical protein HQ585_06335 [candidate division KSB1 bacterium]|nr:hypothetical protein [candidate division KSB1 bacterium]